MKNKIFIKQFIINKNGFQDWALNNSDLINNNKIVGYLFYTNKINGCTEPVKLLNLYLIKRDTINVVEVDESALNKAWELFFIKLNIDIKHKNVIVFTNPPIEQWLDSKENWCKKIASNISNTFNWNYDEALSEVYLSIMKLYNKKSVYLGNLNYVRKSIYNYMLMNIRANKIRLNGDNVIVQSLDTVVTSDEGDDDITLGDMISSEVVQTEKSLDYQLLLNNIKELLRKDFSDREIDQILIYRPEYLPPNLYRRLLNWRKNHKVEELYE